MALATLWRPGSGQLTDRPRHRKLDPVTVEVTGSASATDTATIG